MELRTAAILFIAGIPAVALPAAGSAACSVHSGQRTAALIELYTSEGCSSCPPADQKLARLPQVLEPGAEAFALALHVNYWDSIGWQDPYAQSVFSERQSWLVHANHHDVVYTPHFFVSGTELSPGQDGLRDEVIRVNARPAKAEIQLNSSRTSNGALMIDVVAHAPEGVGPAALYLALAENGLVSKVLRGENGGLTLTHEHVARTWIGPIVLTNETAQVHREMPLPGGAVPAQLELVAFVEDEHTGKILQAVGSQACTRAETPVSRATEFSVPGSESRSSNSTRSTRGDG